MVLNNPALVLRAHQAGHQIAIHTWSHPSLPALTDDQVVAELVWTARIIKDVTGVTPAMFRPPYGETSPRLRQLANGLGFKIINWNRDTNDWQFTNYPGSRPGGPFSPSDTPSAISQLVSRWMSDPMTGTISLHHDIADAPTSQMAPILEVLARSSYQLQTVAECLKVAPYDDAILTRLNIVAPPTTTSMVITASTSSSSSSYAVPTSTFTNVTPTATVSSNINPGPGYTSTTSKTPAPAPTDKIVSSANQLTVTGLFALIGLLLLV